MAVDVVGVPIIQVVGYQNSGKTTMVEKIITHFSTIGIKVGTIKHHGHGGTPVSLDEGKDSFRHRKAGAVSTIVEGAGTLQLQISKADWELADILNIYRPFGLDVILIEGYKDAPYKKVVMIRKEEDIELLTKLNNIAVVITWISLGQEWIGQFKVISIDNNEQLNEWLNNVLEDFHE